jgi:hypothetical protein
VEIFESSYGALGVVISLFVWREFPELFKLNEDMLGSEGGTSVDGACVLD